MTIEELEKENKELKERVKFLESIVNKGSTGNTAVYNTIRTMIKEKVYPIIPEDDDWRGKDYKRTKVERKVMADLKWRN